MHVFAFTFHRGHYVTQISGKSYSTFSTHPGEDSFPRDLPLFAPVPARVSPSMNLRESL
jgi:hypothetical protein